SAWLPPAGNRHYDAADSIDPRNSLYPTIIPIRPNSTKPQGDLSRKFLAEVGQLNVRQFGAAAVAGILTPAVADRAKLGSATDDRGFIE
ncbi:MAG TPA: hypothetical protein VFE46_15690, partial [Pirellulales bacterium]|nr:hypothetical protein [Pirellulales bacterium]